MAKYYFREKLEEGVLYTKSGILTAAIRGTEYKAVFPPGRSPKHVERESIPCLARKCSNTEMKCMVEAVSADSLELEKKDWICINPLLLKNAAEFFLGSYSMPEITRCYPNYKKDQIIASQCIDFIASDGTMIDLRFLKTGVDTAYGRKQNGSYSILTPGFIMGYVNILNIPKYTENRMILLFVQQREPVSQNPVPAMNGKTYESVRTGCAYGLEFWNAVIRADAEGISLCSYKCITDDNLSGAGLYSTGCTIRPFP